MALESSSSSKIQAIGSSSPILNRPLSRDHIIMCKQVFLLSQVLAVPLVGQLSPEGIQGASRLFVARRQTCAPVPRTAILVAKPLVSLPSSFAGLYTEKVS